MNQPTGTTAREISLSILAGCWRQIVRLCSVDNRRSEGRLFVAGLAVLMVLVGTLGSSATEPAESLTNRARLMTARVDELLNERMQQLGWQPAPDCDDATFLRRAYLDLTGMAPVAREVLDFLESTAPNKREELVDRLLASSVSAGHLANTWAHWLLPDTVGLEFGPGRNGLHTWLRQRFAENLRYDRLVADLLVSTGSTENSPTSFFVALENKPEKIAAKTARVFMGVQLDCAECHNHPFDSWKQTDFWGFAAYFANLSTNADQMGPIAEVNDAGTVEVKLPGTEQVVAPKPLVETGVSGLGTGTRRQQLTLWLTTRENPFLARAAVNRSWSLLFGRGLIEPIDDMRSLEIATHPQLLKELSEYFASTGYDLRHLLSLLAKTQAYRRATQHANGPSPEGSYAVMLTKPLTETQLTACMLQVARQVAGDPAAGPPNAPQPQPIQALAQQLGKLRGESSQASLGIVQALVTLHGTAFDQVSRDGSSRLLQALDAPHMDDAKRVRWMFLSTLNRPPSAQEQQAFSDLIGESKERAVWQSDLLWALINSTEFAMTP